MAISSTKHEYHCALSPDGRRVAFTSTRSGDAEIWVSDPDGSNEIQLTSMRAQDTNCARWSPDGQFIEFSSNGEGEFDVYIVPAAGGKPRRLTSHPAMDLAAGFSRDGNWIYFNSLRTGDYRVFRIPVAGGEDEAVLVTPNNGTQTFEAPDSGSIYYLTSAVESPLWQLPISGGDPVKILDRVLWFNFWLFGKGAYYIDQRDGERRLQYLNLVTGKSTIIAGNLGDVSAGLTATPDGKTILFTRLDAFAEDLMLVENFR
jgi:Tol biopolymer transport system component